MLLQRKCAEGVPHTFPSSPTRIETLKARAGSTTIEEGYHYIKDQCFAKLIQAGVEVVTIRYNATLSRLVMLNAIADAAPTRAAMRQAIDSLKSTGGGTY